MQKVSGEPPNLAKADHYRPLPPLTVSIAARKQSKVLVLRVARNAGMTVVVHCLARVIG
jgi:hypothetical protein